MIILNCIELLWASYQYEAILYVLTDSLKYFQNWCISKRSHGTILQLKWLTMEQMFSIESQSKFVNIDRFKNRKTQKFE